MQKSPDRWVFSPLVFLASSGFIALIITKGEIDYPFLLISGITAIMYIWPKWREFPNMFHDAFMLVFALAFAIGILWILQGFLVKKEKTYE